MTNTDDQLLEVEDSGLGIWLLRLHRPEARNALSVGLRDTLSQNVEVLGERSDTRAMVLTGSGSMFCAGFDLSEFGHASEDPEARARLWASSDRFHHSILRCPVPLLCALNGPALAGGFDLATLCDLRIAHPKVWFARPEVGFGVPLFGPLRELVGGSLARELCLTERRVEAEEALRIGLVNQVVEARKVVETTVELARQIAGRPPEAVRALKSKIVAASSLAARPTLAL